jgi:hypothetical protein
LAINTASKRRIASIKRDDALILRHYANPTGWNFRERQPEVAHMLGISQATVKTHLQRIFGKTGTARQADLDDRFHESCHKRGIHLSFETPYIGDLRAF